MSLLIPIFVGGGEGNGGLLNFRGGWVVKKRESPDLRSPEVGISVDPRETESHNPFLNSINLLTY